MAPLLIGGAVPRGIDAAPVPGRVDSSVARALAASPDGTVAVIAITRGDDYARATTLVGRLGGQVTREFAYVTGFAARLPASAVARLAAHPDVAQVFGDLELALARKPDPETAVPSRRPGDPDDVLELPRELPASQVVRIEPAQVDPGAPETFVGWRTQGMNASPAWGDSAFGRNSIVAVIDTGIYSAHPMLAGTFPGAAGPTVIGGIDLSTDTATPAFAGHDRLSNDWHGSAVASDIAGHATLVAPANSLLVAAIEDYMSQYSGAPFAFPPGPSGTKLVPLLGMAPAAQIYAIKVFPHTGGGAPFSTIVAAVEHAIGLKEAFAAGQPGGVDVDVINMSLGGATLFDGRGPDALAVQVALQHGITVVSAAGNDGPAPMTVSDPGAAEGGIAAAAGVHPVNTRVAWDLFLGVRGIGESLYVADTARQVISFSSRGPTAEGRAKPDVTATGVDVLSAFPTTNNQGTGLAFVSGTSFATPNTAGTAALLNGWAELNLGTDGATPEDIKQAILSGASAVTSYSPVERGAGYVDAAAALAQLQAQATGGLLGDASPILSDTPPFPAPVNIAGPGALNTGATPFVGTFIQNDITLGPGQNLEFAFRTGHDTREIRVALTGVIPGANPNALAQAVFPNSVEVYIHDAERGGTGFPFGYYVDSTNVVGDATFTIRDLSTGVQGAVFGAFLTNRPIMPGFTKVVVEGDWSNGAPVSFDLTITVDGGAPAGSVLASGTVAQDEFVFIGPFNLSRGQQLELRWPTDWTAYPTDDLDLYVLKTANFSSIVNASGATIDAPERIVLEDSGKFFLGIHGFSVFNGAEEPWEVRTFSP